MGLCRGVSRHVRSALCARKKREKRAFQLLARAHGQVVVEVKHGLLPVRVLRVRARREADRRVRLRERDVEVRAQRVHLRTKTKRRKIE